MSFTLPQLPYGFDALEPNIDARTMEIHYEKHHQGYTNNLNGAIEGTNLEGKSKPGTLVKAAIEEATRDLKGDPGSCILKSPLSMSGKCIESL